MGSADVDGVHGESLILMAEKYVRERVTPVRVEGNTFFNFHTVK